MNTKISLFLCALTLSGIAIAQDPMQPAPAPSPAQAEAPKDLTYSLKRSVTKGQSFKYKIVAELDAADTHIQYTSTLTESIDDVKPNGDYVTKSKQTEALTKVGDKGSTDEPTPTPPDTGSNVTYNAAGEVIDIRSGGSFTGSADWRVANLNVLKAPDAPVKVGDSWSYKINGLAKAGTDANGEYKLLGIEKVGDRQTAKVSVKIKETSGLSPASSEGIFWLDLKDFSMVKCDSVWTNVPVPGEGVLVSGKITISVAP